MFCTVSFFPWSCFHKSLLLPPPMTRWLFFCALFHSVYIRLFVDISCVVSSFFHRRPPPFSVLLGLHPISLLHRGAPSLNISDCSGSVDRRSSPFHLAPVHLICPSGKRRPVPFPAPSPTSPSPPRTFHSLFVGYYSFRPLIVYLEAEINDRCFRSGLG